MNSIFQSYLCKFVIFFYGILVYSDTWEAHLIHLRLVFGVLTQHQLFLKKSKCVFGATKVEYLGHIINQGVVSMDEQKVVCKMNWPSPQSAKDLRGFLGLTGYYHKFIRGYGIIAQPLTGLLKKNSFQWTSTV